MLQFYIPDQYPGERRGEREGCTTAFIFLQFESERGAVLKLEVQTKASFK